MTVKELKEKIKDLPDYMEVFISQQCFEYENSLVNSAEAKEIIFTDEEIEAPAIVFVLEDF